MEFKAGDRVSVPMYADCLAKAKPEDWCDAILLRYDEGGAMLYPTNGEPYPRPPSWQVRVLSPGRGFDKWVVSVEPDCIRKI